MRTGSADEARFATNADRVAHYAELRPLLADWCAARSSSALLADLHAADIPAGPVRSIDELAVDPRLEARGMLAHIELANGTQLIVPGSPIHFSDVEAQSPQRGPRLGEHTRSVLMNRLGLHELDLRQLTAREVIVCCD